MLDSRLVFCTLLGPEGPGRRLRVSIGPLDLVVTATMLSKERQAHWVPPVF